MAANAEAGRRRFGRPLAFAVGAGRDQTAVRFAATEAYRPARPSAKRAAVERRPS